MNHSLYIDISFLVLEYYKSQDIKCVYKWEHLSPYKPVL